MVTRWLLFVCLFAISLSSIACEQCSKGAEFEPSLCPLKLPKITKLTINENAVKSSAEKDQKISCSSFLVKESHIRRYFAQAKTTNEDEVHHKLDWSPCFANGEVFFSDGRKGQWSVNQFRVGSIGFNNEEKYVLYCPQCKYKPFIW